MNGIQAQKEKEFLQEFEKHGIIGKGHFLLRSGKHAKEYVQKDKLYLFHNLLAKITNHLLVNCISCEALSKIDIVAAPEKGGIILANVVTRELSLMTDRTVYGIYAAKEEKEFYYYVPNQGSQVQKVFVRLNSFTFRKAYAEIISNKKVLVIDDICTTGGSFKKVIDAVRLLGGVVENAACIWNRGGIIADDLGVKNIFSVIKKKLDSWDPPCPLCKENVPLISLK